MNRPAWSPDTASQRQRDLLEAAREATATSKAAAAAAARAEADAWAAIKAVRDAGVPDTWLPKLLPDLSRATLNRKLGSRSGADGD